VKVVLFCGGLGMRLRDYDENLPKPMVTIGYRPILWHVMKYYAHFGHKDFVLCLGHKADVIKRYFLDYDECLSNDFHLSEGGERVELVNSDIDDWRITFVDTGTASPIGERLRRVRPYLEGESMFLANYTDCLTDMDLNAFVDYFCAQDRTAGFVTVVPNVSQHYVTADGGIVRSLTDVHATALRVNGGFFAFRQEIFDYLRPGEELVDGPFQRLIGEEQLVAYEYDGFWKAMDTFKDKQQMDELVRTDSPPWALWLGAPAAPAAAVTVGAAGVMRRRRRLRVRPGSMVSPLRRRSSDLPEDSP
jgi:glucose-1-phosphate cytidylyltransferase